MPPTQNRANEDAAKAMARSGGVFGPVVRWMRDFLLAPDDFYPPITYEDAEGWVVTLEDLLGGTTSAGADDFDVPNTHIYLVTEIRGHFGWGAALTGETTIAFGGNALAGAANDNASRAAMLQKAANTKIDLKIANRQRKVFEGAMRLSDILLPVGGEPLKFEKVPLIIPPGYKVKMDITPEVATAAQQGADFYSGLTFIGTLVKC